MTTLILLVMLVVGFLPQFVEAPIAFFAPPQLEKKEARVIFGGDMMFDRSVRKVVDEKGGDFIFSCIAHVLLDADLVVANLEGPITHNESVSAGSIVGSPDNYVFTFPTSTAELLTRHNIKLVSIGNNHIMNFSREGLLQTKEWLDASGVAYFGDPAASESDRVARADINGVRFSFVSWSDWTGGSKNGVIKQVRAEADSGRVVVVYAHWGEEYVPVFSNSRELAHSFVDAGARIVVGSHPHIVQGHERYNGKDIYYSLGNFVFDQYWDANVSTGLLLRVTFDTAGAASIEEIPIKLGRDRRTCLVE